ncbi:integration host factor subunit alpha [Cardiobacterium valvarum]|uniref:Integration host factor subunit alpha n=1 Tax=Cardiobacterium valvarum F0432 TaxID=797473 RepID=G9ZC99_9GAMM|nr:integration host factor subunit alpha [Cardiobacterium valvarum]EHM55799.1 integration host factor, alpha subunit [Cardiobacterium valvarum F0432]
MTLTKADIVESIIAQIGVPRPEARQIVDELFEDSDVCLSAGEIVKLSGFGNFELRDKKQRPGRNPKTGEEIPITARRVVSFKAGQKLKARVSGSKPRG